MNCFIYELDVSIFSFAHKITHSSITIYWMPAAPSLVKTTANVKTSPNKMWSLEGWATWRWGIMIGFLCHGSIVNISSGMGLKGLPSFFGDRKTNRLTLSCEWLSYIYLIIIERLGTGTPSTCVTVAAFSTSVCMIRHKATDESLFAMGLES